MSYEYKPGVCNIGETEIRHRRTTYGFGGLVLVLAFYVILRFFGVSFFGYLLLFFPLYTSVLGFIQAKEKFSIAYGKIGVVNVSGQVGETRDVIGRLNRNRDIQRSKELLKQTVSISVLLTVLIAAISSI
jgi:hypothetical protein